MRGQVKVLGVGLEAVVVTVMVAREVMVLQGKMAERVEAMVAARAAAETAPRLLWLLGAQHRRSRRSGRGLMTGRWARSC